jgi:hypothetical protein
MPTSGVTISSRFTRPALGRASNTNLPRSSFCRQAAPCRGPGAVFGRDGSRTQDLTPIRDSSIAGRVHHDSERLTRRLLLERSRYLKVGA